MANITIENIDTGSVIIEDEKFNDVILAFPGADTYAEGTILARKQVADAIVVAADAGNTGDGTVTLASVIAGDTIPLVGAYNLEVVGAVTNGGVFKLEDPNGAILANDITMTAGAGAATTFYLEGMTFTITDGATDFIVGDKFSLTVAADGDVVIFAEDGIGGAQVPSMVLTYEIKATGAADVAARAMVSGSVRREKLVIDAGGTVTDRIVDGLRDFGIVARSVDELNIADNQ
jgi:hypothetical protein